jgi:hypothetical protein
VQESGVPAPVRRFIAGHIESVGQLEVLLLLRAAADKQWTTDELAESYAKYRVAVIGLIFSKPSEHVRDFPEAFRLRRPKH